MAASRLAADDYPNRPITIVVPFAAGGAPDLVARMLADELSDKLGKPVIVDDRPGASGNIGAAAVSRATPDGHTLLLGTPYPMLLNKLMTAKLSFDPETDLEPISLVGKSPQIFATRPDAPWRELGALIEHLKKNPGSLTAGIPGVGTTSHLAIEALTNLIGSRMVIVPYRGTTPISDILGGQVDVAVSLVPSYVGLVRSGSLYAIAVTTDRRSDQLPDTPTVQELGYPGFDVSAWYVLAGPAGMPKPILQRLNALVTGFLENPQWRSRLADLDVQRVGGDAEHAKAFLKSEIARYAPIIKAADIKL